MVIDDLDRKHFCDIYVSPLKIPNKEISKKKAVSAYLVLSI